MAYLYHIHFRIYIQYTTIQMYFCQKQINEVGLSLVQMERKKKRFYLPLMKYRTKTVNCEFVLEFSS